jgi:hypothetical protein
LTMFTLCVPDQLGAHAAPPETPSAPSADGTVS